MLICYLEGRCVGDSDSEGISFTDVCSLPANNYKPRKFLDVNVNFILLYDQGKKLSYIFLLK